MGPTSPSVPAGGSRAGARDGIAAHDAWRASVLVGVAAFALYLWLAPHASGDRDSSEFTLVLALDGIAHPTGYPLYTLLGHAFVQLAHHWGAGWAFAANAWSALGGAVAVGLMHALSLRLSPAPGHPASLPPALLVLGPVALLGLDPAWTQFATVAEVYSWHLAWVMGMALAYVKFLGGGKPAVPSQRLSIAWGLLCGVGLAHHATSALVVLPLTVALLARVEARRRLAWLVRASVTALVPLAAYLLLRYRQLHPGPADWPALDATWRGWWEHVTARAYAGHFGRFQPDPMERGLIFGAVLPFLVPGLLALGLGAWRATGGPVRRAFAGLLAVASLQLVFAFLYGVDDPSSHFLPPLALGLAAIVPAAGWFARGVRAPLATAAAAAALGAALVLGVPWLRTERDLRGQLDGLDDFVHTLWATIPDGPGVVLWPRDMSARLLEYQWLRGEKRQLDVVNPWQLTYDAARRRFRARHGRDPLAGVSVARQDLLSADATSERSRAFVAAVASAVAAGTPEPVYLFEPEVPRVTRVAGAGSIPRPRP